MKKSFKYLLVAGAMTLPTLQSCTNLDETLYSEVEQANFGKTAGEAAALLGPAYSSLGGYSWNIHNLECSADDMMVPTRGSDWFDNGNWQAYKKHSWTSQHGPINDIWGFCYGGISTTNRLLSQLEGASEQAKAELRGIRAYYYFTLLDVFGNVPLVVDFKDTALPETKTRAEVYAFVEKELTEIVGKLPKGNNTKLYTTFSQGVANALLSKLYLNAQVFKGSPEWAKAISAADAVINSGDYKLAGSVLENFTTKNEGSQENIFIVPYDSRQFGGMNIQMRTLHYKNKETYNLCGDPWNGFCTVSAFYNSFDDKDARKAMWLAGPQNSPTGAPYKDNVGDNLVFTPEMYSMNTRKLVDGLATPEDQNLSQGSGARWQKYEIQRNNTSCDQDNDGVILRLSDVILMKAEAQFRSGNTAGALATINQVRTRSGVAAFTSLSLDDILAERGRELAGEAWRRNDLIRFGKFNQAWEFKAASPATRQLMPIPQPRIDANPKLKQNPGY
jgi:starch-binding outer membrane protein, SusD/RagB family